MRILGMIFVAVAAFGLQDGAGAQEYHQAPDADGVYFVGPEVAAPVVKTAATAVVSKRTKSGGFSVWSVVLHEDGKASDFKLFESAGQEFDEAALEAIRQTEFTPAMLHGAPVAVHVGVAVPFGFGKQPPTPRIAVIEQDVKPDAAGGPAAGGNSAPVVIHRADGIYSDAVIHAKYQGEVLVSAVVGTDGVPGDVQVVRPLGMGLDERAVAAVRLFRFEPAMRAGVPVAQKLTIEMRLVIY